MKKDLRIIFMGTPEFAVPSLELLVEKGWKVVAVITAPDKPAGRGLQLTPSPVKKVALQHHIPVLQPTNLKSPDFLEQLRSYQADLQVVVAFRMLPEAVWAMPPCGTFNLHASLLPQYRGAAPINWAIIHGETETGITTFFLQHEIDTGNIILQEKEPIYEQDTAGTLYERLRMKGARLVLKTVELIAENNVTTFPQPQVEGLKKAPKIFKETCEIDFKKTALEVYNFVRGLSPQPTAWTTLQGKNCKIYSVKPLKGYTWKNHDAILETDGKTYLYFKTADGAVSVEELQLEGKKRMHIAEFLRGYRV